MTTDQHVRLTAIAVMAAILEAGDRSNPYRHDVNQPQAYALRARDLFMEVDLLMTPATDQDDAADQRAAHGRVER